MKVLTPRPFGWWMKRYLDRVGSSDCRFGEYEELFFDPLRGFMCWEVSPGMRELYVTKVCGDGRFWRDKAYEMFAWAKERYGVRYLCCCTRRGPEAFCRLFGGDVFKVEERDGRPLFWIRTKELM
ncbi:hypothetical protein [Cloacibacillus evryensis]|uniref:hypothetical protein n=1 Tax=Cloacibacillus evryensis TaxID=508460 RepID=UPI000450466E|nr:hypothetical protein [Cloacibacillus evryensis]EXG78378.1 hypothetical protein Cloev_0497 [Cloacibacillus evryensis DSM 19522]MEA5035082.1 hypothetical protein [Cloacibacillus evryensis]